MDGVGTVLFSQLDDLGNIQIGAQRALVLTDQIGFIRSGTEDTIGIFVGVNGDGLESQVVAGPENAHGNLAPVCHQNFFKFPTHGVRSSFL